jgi:hypothetical protein
MTIISKPANQAYRDNFDATFGRKTVSPKSFEELKPVCKLRDGVRCHFHPVTVTCMLPLSRY